MPWNPTAAEGIIFMANHYGADGKIDAQGRVTLPTDLRQGVGAWRIRKCGWTVRKAA